MHGIGSGFRKGLVLAVLMCASVFPLFGGAAASTSADLPLVNRSNGFKLEAEQGILASAQVLVAPSASGKKVVAPDGKSAEPQTQFLEFRFMGRSRKVLEMYLRLKVEGEGKVRFYYEIDKQSRYPVELAADGAWQMRQISRLLSYRTEPHSVRIYSNDSRLKIDSLHFEDCAVERLPEGKSLRILPPARKPRIVVRDVNYVPANVGDAIVCLWKNDAVACATYTVDDNHAEEISWWLDTAKKYGVRVTWFIICHRIGKGHPVAGSWDDFRKVLAAGHDVQSHSYSHLNDRNLTIDEEYYKAVEAFEKNLPDHKLEVLAYPGGKLMSKNLDAISARYHIGSRGVAAHANVPNSINYMCTNSFATQSLDPKSRMGLPNLVSPSADRRYRKFYRGWYCHHFHNVRGKFRDQVAACMDFYQKHKVWTPAFVEVIKYGQERDSATLKTLQNKPTEIVLSLTDQMDDSIYTYPLTIRVHVPDDWQAATVTQNGKAQEQKVIDINGKKTLMFDAIPDRGEIKISKTN